MAKRGTLYRCNLFSFGGPQTKGVQPQWTLGLATIGGEVLSGQRVELYVTVDAGTHVLAADSQVRFDILEQDFFLTGGLDDRTVSLVGTGAAPSDEGFITEFRTTLFQTLAEGESVQDRVLSFIWDHPDNYLKYLLIIEENSTPTHQFHVLTWWDAHRLRDRLNSEFYFIVNVDGAFEAQSEPVLNVSATPVETRIIEVSLTYEDGSPMAHAEFEAEFADRTVQSRTDSSGAAFIGPLLDSDEVFRVRLLTYPEHFTDGETSLEVAGAVDDEGVIQLEWLYEDGSPMSDAEFEAVFGDTVIRGRTVADGSAVVRVEEGYQEAPFRLFLISHPEEYA